MVKALLDKAATTNVDGSSATVMGPPEAVKGPMVAAVVGKSTPRPELGTVVGMGTSKAIDPVEILSGEAPKASTALAARPLKLLFPRPVAADTSPGGSGMWV